MTRSRLLAVTVLFVLFQPIHAEAARRRPVRLEGTTLSGRVLDEADSSPVFGAIVRVQGKSFTADANGAYTATGLQAGPATVSFERWGYQPAQKSVTIRTGPNSVDARLAPKPVIQLVDMSGKAFRLDYELASFSTAAPLSSPVPLSPAEFCRADGTITKLEKSELSRLNGSGLVTQNGVCCPTGGEGANVTVTPKSGAAFEAVMQDCRFYRYQFVSRDRGNGQWVYLTFRQVSEIRFP